MKKLFLVVMCALMLCAPAFADEPALSADASSGVMVAQAVDYTEPAPAESGVFDSLPPASLSAIYARAFDGQDEGLAMKLGIAVYQDSFLSIDYSLEADVVGFIGTSAIGVGASVNLKDFVGTGINIGVGYLPKGLGWSWWVGLIEKSF